MKSKSISDSIGILNKELREMKSKKMELDSEIYKLEQAIEKLTTVTGMQRIKRVFHDKICQLPSCHKAFKAKRIDAEFCSIAHQKEAKKLARKGTPIIKGDNLTVAKGH